VTLFQNGYLKKALMKAQVPSKKRESIAGEHENQKYKRTRS
jgi:hypothetical protein